MTEALIAGIVGFITSLLLENVSGLKEWWSGFAWKRLVLLFFFPVIAVAWWALACFAGLAIIPPTNLACDGNGVVGAIVMGVFAFAGTQTGWVTIASKSRNAVARNGT